MATEKEDKKKIGFQDQLLINAGQKNCRTLQGEHSAILSTVIMILILSIFEWPLRPVSKAVVLLLLTFLFIITPIVGVRNCSMFCCTLLYVHSSIAIILMGKRELIALLNLSS